MGIVTEIELYCKAKYPLIWVQTSEEKRLGRILNAAAKNIKRELICWSFTEGLRNKELEPVGQGPTNMLPKALAEIKKHPTAAIVMLKDPHKQMQETMTTRLFRDMYHDLKGQLKTLVICSPMLEIPPEMMQEVTIVDLPLPDAEEIELIMKESLEGLKEQAEDGDERAQELYPVLYKQMWDKKDAIISAGMGLTSEAMENILAKCIAMHKIDVTTILEEKQQAIRKGGLLEFYQGDTSIGEVGGLENLKHWLDLRERALSPEAKAYGLPVPKGMILVGVPGTGKSLLAKSLANRWGLPLLRLDVGSLFGSLVGQSEDRTRKVLAQTEAMSPCILMIDEVEKGLSFGSGDGGTSQRVFASILTWMQEKKKFVFVIATANNISILPPELQRKGRFDEIFFLDIPHAQERAEIFAIHIRRAAKCDPKDFEIDRLVAESNEFVGSEIEQSIIDAMYSAFADGMRKITTDDILAAMKKVVPISKSQMDNINELRKMLKEGRAISASAPQKAEKVLRKVEV